MYCAADVLLTSEYSCKQAGFLFAFRAKLRVATVRSSLYATFHIRSSMSAILKLTSYFQGRNCMSNRMAEDLLAPNLHFQCTIQYLCVDVCVCVCVFLYVCVVCFCILTLKK
jgi:hypothetical protein